MVDQEDHLLKRCGAQVLSPRNETREGKEKQMRREKFLKAGKLAESWRMQEVPGRKLWSLVSKNARKSLKDKRRREAAEAVNC